MKKAKILVLVAALLCVVTVLSACGSSVKELKIKKLYEQKYEETPVLATGAQSSDLKGVCSDDNDRNLLLFADGSLENNVFTVYNVETGATVYTFTETATLYVDEINLHDDFDADSFIAIYYDTTDPLDWKYTSELYDGKGNKIATVNKYDDGEYVLDLILFGDVVYRIAPDGTIAEAFKVSSLGGGLPSLDSGVGDYYFYSDSSNTLVIYDKECKFIKKLYVPSYAEGEFFPLNDGTVLVNYAYELPDDAEDYDLYLNDAKMKVVSYLYNPEKDKTTDYEMDYMFEMVLPVSAKYDYGMVGTRFGLAEDYENLAAGYPIDWDNKRVDMGTGNAAILVLTNKGKVQGAINTQIENQGANLFEEFANGYVTVSNVVGQNFLLKADGELVGEITGMTWGTQNEKFFEADGKIYDFSLNVIYDMEADNAEIEQTLSHGYIIEKAGAYYLFTGNKDAMVLIDGADDTLDYQHNYSEQYYAVVNIADPLNPVYTYYNTNGAKLLDNGSLLTKMITSDDGKAVMLYAYDMLTGTYTYFRFAA